MSLTSVDLPEPDTPVTATKQPSGISTSMFLRLCSRAPLTTSQSLSGRRRISGTGIARRPDRYCPVTDLRALIRPETLPE